MVISSVGVSTVPTGLLLRPESVLTDVVVELLHPQSTAGTSVGACKGTHQSNLQAWDNGYLGSDSSILTIISSSPTMDQNLHQFVS